MLSLRQIQAAGKDGKFYAVSSFNALYEAVYDASLRVMFFCIPEQVEIIGYIER